jgi:phage gpG-like protein
VVKQVLLQQNVYMRNLRQFQYDMERWRREQERIMRTGLPRAAGAIAVKGILANFRNETYPTSSRWRTRKGTAPRNKGRKLLVDSGRLRRSFRQRGAAGMVSVWTDTPYAKVHNEGLKVTGTASIPAHSRRTKSGRMATVRAHTRKINFNMPKRQFMPIPGEPLPPDWRKEIDQAAVKLFKEADRVFAQGR